MRKIKWGVLGTANIAKGCTIPGMQLAENCELYAVAGRSLEKAERFKSEFGFEKAYDSYEALLDDPAVEAVYILLPNSLHCEWVVRAAKAGKHILCEKPLAPSAAQAAKMQAAARENGVLLMEAFAYLHSPLTAAIKAELDRGTIGEVRYLENAFVTSDYDLSNIRMRRETLGGSLYDLGCYCISQAVWLLGEPETVRAAADFSDEGVDRLTTGFLSYPGGVRAAFTCGMVLPTEQSRRLDRLQIHGTKGVLRTDAEYNQAGRLSYQIVTDGQVVTRCVDVPQNYSLEVAQLGRCIASGEQPHVSADFTLATARTMDKALAAIGY
ncbi:MAG: Gfo/Idh/MocA family oxidoreductase [Clostridia bacterium]|nr:Gfo/Idh/MocA family oxidoreductase [Clostridia bacterium]